VNRMDSRVPSDTASSDPNRLLPPLLLLLLLLFTPAPPLSTPSSPTSLLLVSLLLLCLVSMLLLPSPACAVAESADGMALLGDPAVEVGPGRWAWAWAGGWASMAWVKCWKKGVPRAQSPRREKHCKPKEKFPKCYDTEPSRFVFISQQSGQNDDGCFHGQWADIAECLSAGGNRADIECESQLHGMLATMTLLHPLPIICFGMDGSSSMMMRPHILPNPLNPIAQ
jgi:hypothetical protein